MQALTNNLTPDADVRQTRPVARATSAVDARGYTVSGGSAAAIAHFETACAAFQSWRNGAERAVADALREAPGFTMAHILQAYLFLCGRDPVRVRAAAPAYARALALPANERERMHIAAIGAALGDDYDRSRTLMGELLRRYPRDALALQVAHVLDYMSGDVENLTQRVAGVLPAWSSELPGYHAILAMHAFGLEEAGEYDHAEDIAAAALDLNPSDARAHHVKAHVFEMTERPADGVRWLGRHSARIVGVWSCGPDPDSASPVNFT
jgi:hypothetical protein